MTFKAERSTDGGKTWHAVDVGARSVVGYYLSQLPPGAVYNDRVGNQYRKAS